MVTTAYRYLPGSPGAAPRVAEDELPAPLPPQTIVPGTVTPEQADQYVTEETRARITAQLGQCDNELAQWDQRAICVHDLNAYIDAAQAQKDALPNLPKEDPMYLAATEALRVGLNEQIDVWKAQRQSWNKASEAKASIKKRRDAIQAYLDTMIPPEETLIGYPVPAPPMIAYAEQSAVWPKGVPQ